MQKARWESSCAYIDPGREMGKGGNLRTRNVALFVCLHDMHVPHCEVKAGLLGGHVQLFFLIFVIHESTGTKSCTWPLVSLKFGSLQRVCDSHWGRCLWGLQAFGKHYNPSSLWGLTASRLSCRKQGERVPVRTLTLAERWPLPIFLLGSIYAHEMSLFSCAYMTCMFPIAKWKLACWAATCNSFFLFSWFTKVLEQRAVRGRLSRVVPVAKTWALYDLRPYEGDLQGFSPIHLPFDRFWSWISMKPREKHERVRRNAAVFLKISLQLLELCVF